MNSVSTQYVVSAAEAQTVTKAVLLEAELEEHEGKANIAH